MNFDQHIVENAFEFVFFTKFDQEKLYEVRGIRSSSKFFYNILINTKPKCIKIEFVSKLDQPANTNLIKDYIFQLNNRIKIGFFAISGNDLIYSSSILNTNFQIEKDIKICIISTLKYMAGKLEKYIRAFDESISLNCKTVEQIFKALQGLQHTKSVKKVKIFYENKEVFMQDLEIIQEIFGFDQRVSIIFRPGVDIDQINLKISYPALTNEIEFLEYLVNFSEEGMEIIYKFANLF